MSREAAIVLVGRRVEAPASFARLRPTAADRAERLRGVASMALSSLVHVLVLILFVEVAWLSAPVEEPRVVELSLRRERPREPAVAPAAVAAAPSAAAPAEAVAPTPEPTPAPLPTAPAPAPALPSVAVSGEILPSIHAFGAAGEAPAATGPYSLRTPSERSAAVSRHGGNAASESAVDLGLRWLAAHQGKNGLWSPSGSGLDCPGGGACYASKGWAEADAGVTGLALLAFLGAGFGPSEGEHRGKVARAIRGLLDAQDASGFFFDPAAVSAGNRGEMYGHGMAFFALAEAASMTGDPSLIPPLERAVRATASAQQADGGWSYLPDPRKLRGELTLSVWALQGLEAAGRAGAAGGAAALARARDFLLRSQVPGGGFAYTSASQPTLGSTGAGLFAACRLGLGDAVSLDGGLRALALQEKSDPELGSNRGWHPIYAWYYRTLAAFQAQGKPWRDWNRKLRPFLVSTQQTGGHAAGSWTIIDYASGSTVYSTSLCVLMLETYYRYPLQTAGASVRGLSAGPVRDESAPLSREEERRIEELVPPSPAQVEARRRREIAEARADLGSERPERRYFASRRLAEAGDREAVHGMIGAARRESGRLRAAHLQHLGKLGSEQALGFLEEELGAGDPEAGAAALAAISAITGEYLADAESARRLLRSRR